MAEGPKQPRAADESARQVLEQMAGAPPPRRSSALGSYLMLLVALAIVGVIAYYIFVHKQQFAQLWQRTMRPDSVPTQVEPGR
jgi:hypothetical protein